MISHEKPLRTIYPSQVFEIGSAGGHSLWLISMTESVGSQITKQLPTRKESRSGMPIRMAKRRLAEKSGRLLLPRVHSSRPFIHDNDVARFCLTVEMNFGTALGKLTHYPVDACGN